MISIPGKRSNNRSGEIIELEELLALCRNLNELFDFQAVSETLVEEIMRITDAEAGTFWFLDEESETYFPAVVRGPRSETLREMYLQEGEGIVGKAIEQGESLLVEDVSGDERWASRFDISTGFITRSIIVLPVSARGIVIGAIQVVNKKNGLVFTREDLQKSQRLIDNAAIIILNSLVNTNKEKFLESLSRVLISLIESRDPSMKGHAERVCRYSLLIADEMEKNEADKKMIKFAALLHDIGKAVEVEEEKHSTAGAQIVYHLEPGRLIRPIWLGVLYHHERFDGNGYPAGLKGEDIPLIARIIALSDFYDYLQIDTDLASRFEPLEELKQYAGSYFDPDLVDVFVRAVNKSKV